MAKKSLASVLKIQWWLHTCFTSLFFIALTFFFLFAIEDYFHEKQLVDISHIIAFDKSVQGIPNHIQLYHYADIPENWRTELERIPLNTPIETTSLQDITIHLLHSKFIGSEERFVLVLDTSKTNSIWAISDRLLLLILPWILIFLAVASFLAKKFIRQLQEHFQKLLTMIKETESPALLKAFSERQPINEVAQLGFLFSQVWQEKIALLSREKQSLEYLSHELRTPIQSSLATLELLALKISDTKTIERLTRSLNRMTRLSNAILYLMESENSLPSYQVDIEPICQQLVDELIPLAEVKQQTIVLNSMLDSQALNIVATQEVIETILSILLTNALQHSNSSPIIITLHHDKISIENEVKHCPDARQNSTIAGVSQQGFGIGLTIAERLANKFNLTVNLAVNDSQKVIATIAKKS